MIGRAIVPIVVDTSVALGSDAMEAVGIDLPDKGTVHRVIAEFLVSTALGGPLSGMGALYRGWIDAESVETVKDYCKTAKDRFDKLSKSLA